MASCAPWGKSQHYVLMRSWGVNKELKQGQIRIESKVWAWVTKNVVTNPAAVLSETEGRRGAEFGKELKTLAEKAYPNLGDAAKERLDLNQYLAQLNNPKVTFAVKLSRPVAVDCAVWTINLGDGSRTPNQCQVGLPLCLKKFLIQQLWQWLNQWGGVMLTWSWFWTEWSGWRLSWENCNSPSIATPVVVEEERKQDNQDLTILGTVVDRNTSLRSAFPQHCSLLPGKWPPLGVVSQMPQDDQQAHVSVTIPTPSVSAGMDCVLNVLVMGVC